MKRLGGLIVAAGVALTTNANAFCGFYVSGGDSKLYNNATQVVMMREGTRTVLSMENNYEGPPENFAMVVPVPVVLQKENVKTLAKALFDKVDQLDAPRLVEYWEQDPCPKPMPDTELAENAPTTMATATASPTDVNKKLGVKVEAQFTVGEYEIVILSAKDAAGLDAWLKQEKYKIPSGSEPYFRPYVQQGSKFFVARVDYAKVTKDAKGNAILSPLRFHYDSEQFVLPVRLGLVSSKGTQDLIIHLLGRAQRYEVANYPNVTIPTNLDVSEKARTEFGSFYAALFDATLAKTPKAVVTEYAWDATTCDPCPGPTLDPTDLATLGADVARSGLHAGVGFTLTRLHARYTKESLGDDLVFKEAPPIAGGREEWAAAPQPTMPATLEHGSRPSVMNNFQGRYAIRHPWTGPIECKNPVRGAWGGPPAGTPPPRDPSSSAPKAAKDLAFAPRSTPLPPYLRSEVPELGVKPAGETVSGAQPVRVLADGGVEPLPNPKKSSCGCEVGPVRTSWTKLGAALALLFVAVRRGWVRRRRTAKIGQSHGNHTSSPQRGPGAHS